MTVKPWTEELDISWTLNWIYIPRAPGNPRTLHTGIEEMENNGELYPKDAGNAKNWSKHLRPLYHAENKVNHNEEQENARLRTLEVAPVTAHSFYRSSRPY